MCWRYNYLCVSRTATLLITHSDPASFSQSLEFIVPFLMEVYGSGLICLIRSGGKRNTSTTNESSIPTNIPLKNPIKFHRCIQRISGAQGSSLHQELRCLIQMIEGPLSPPNLLTTLIDFIIIFLMK